MSTVTLKGNPMNIGGEIPKNNTKATDFTLVKNDLSDCKLSDFAGKNVILNIFPSIDTGTCAASVREFNQHATSLNNTVVLCISKDLPFAQSRFCAAEGIENVHTLSAFRNTDFANDFGVDILDGPLTGLLARAVVVINPEGNVIYTELVNETVNEPNYNNALTAIA